MHAPAQMTFNADRMGLLAMRQYSLQLMSHFVTFFFACADPIREEQFDHIVGCLHPALRKQVG
jgi:hypothetical protein